MTTTTTLIERDMQFSPQRLCALPAVHRAAHLGGRIAIVDVEERTFPWRPTTQVVQRFVYIVELAPVAGVREAGFHTPPGRLLAVWLDGHVEFETSDGEVRRVTAGRRFSHSSMSRLARKRIGMPTNRHLPSDTPRGMAAGAGVGATSTSSDSR
jgi:hypothetical protein